MRILQILTISQILLLSTLKANAFDFSEVTSGDLPGFNETSNPFILDVGRNTISGETTFRVDGVPPYDIRPSADADSFAFVIPGGTSLESILLDISLVRGSGNIYSIGYVLRGGFLNQYDEQQEISIPSTDLTLFTSILPLSNGLFTLSTSFYRAYIPVPEFSTAAYSFSLNVAELESVPEPNVLPGLGILSLGFLFKRRNRK